MPALIGLLTLMGIVTKISILLVEYIVMAPREHGLSRHEAIIDACSKRDLVPQFQTVRNSGARSGLGAGGNVDDVRRYEETHDAAVRVAAAVAWAIWGCNATRCLVH